MAEISEFRSQLKAVRRSLFTMLASLAVDTGEPDAGDEEMQLRQVLWVCVRELDSYLTEPPPEVDLTAADSATQQRLYDFVVGGALHTCLDP